MDSNDALTSLKLEHAQLVRLLDHSEVLRTALRLLVTDGSAVAWVAEPASAEGLGLVHVIGDRTGALRRCRIPTGLG